MDKIKQVLNKVKLILLDYIKIVKLLATILVLLLSLSLLILAYLSLPIVPFFLNIETYEKVILSLVLFLFQLYVLEIVKELFRTLANRLLLK